MVCTTCRQNTSFIACVRIFCLWKSKNTQMFSIAMHTISTSTTPNWFQKPIDRGILTNNWNSPFPKPWKIQWTVKIFSIKSQRLLLPKHMLTYKICPIFVPLLDVVVSNWSWARSVSDVVNDSSFIKEVFCTQEIQNTEKRHSVCPFYVCSHIEPSMICEVFCVQVVCEWQNWTFQCVIKISLVQFLRKVKFNCWPVVGALLSLILFHQALNAKYKNISQWRI